MKVLLQSLLFLVTFWPVLSFSQNSLPLFAGSVQSVRLRQSTVSIQAENAIGEITACSPTVIRFRIDRKAWKSDHSHAVIRQAGDHFRNFRELNDSAILTTDSLTVVIHKRPLRMSIRNFRGELLSEEEPGMPVSWLGDRVTCYRNLFPDEKFLGLGEKTGNLDKRGNSFENWNSDVPAYAINHDPLYQSIPFFIGIHGRVTYGIFLDNPARTRFNFGASTDEQVSTFSADEGELNYYFFGASTVAGIVADYTWLTGRMTLPPYWSLGYQQCRWSYFPESQVLAVARQFRDRHIPCDVIWLDIDYMDGYKIFTWNRERFPDPKGMTAKLNDMGFHVVTIVDPGIKIEPGYFAYDQGLANRYFATWPDGRNYTGSVWPGRCHFPDFTRGSVRKWWGSSFSRLVDEGVEGFWNDMNEPSAWGQSIPDIIRFDGDFGKASMTRVHNVYGLEMSRATYEGTRSLMNGKRPLILTRAGYAGIQRYSAVWTGDNEATDEHMLLSARMITGLGLSGVSFTGPDVGGFMGNPSEDLYTRWMSMGVYTPFFRNHSAWDTKSKEPWSFGPEVEKKVREMIKSRYRMLPYLYSALYESTVNGMPVARSLAISHTFDPKVYWWKYQNEYLFGPCLLVAPVSCEQRAARVYLPEGTWYRLSSGERFEGNREVTVEAPLDDLPVFARGSAILPMQSDIEHTGQKPSPVLEIHVYNGDRTNSFVYYEDDGITYDFEQGVFHRRTFTFDPGKRSLSLTPAEGSYRSKFSSLRLVLHDFPDILSVRVDGGEKSLKLKSGTEKTVEFPWSDKEMTIGF